MRIRTLALGLAGICAATLAFAHDGVKNPTVMARMEAMKEIGAQMAVLGDMAKGKTNFDADRAQAAARALAEGAAATPALFKARETDPKSEALPSIWENFDDFTTLSMELSDTANASAGTLTDLDSLRAGIGALGNGCKSCHSRYRQ